jgi:hypothetical protein
MSGALRFNEGKPSLAYILQFANPIKAIARIMEFGAMKYADGNWRKGGKPDREYLDSMMRHLTDWAHGEKYDNDSGCSHLGHAIWNLMALHELNHPDEIIDDEVFKRQCAYWKAKKEECVIPAEYCDDSPPLQKNTPLWPKAWEGCDLGWEATSPPKCPECNAPMIAFDQTWKCAYHSSLTKYPKDEEQKEEEELEEGKISFVIRDDVKCASFDALVKKLTAQHLEAKLRAAVFNYLGHTPNVAPTRKDNK